MKNAEVKNGKKIHGIQHSLTRHEDLFKKTRDVGNIVGPHVTQQGLQLGVDLPMTSQLAPNHLALPVLLAVIPSRDESVIQQFNSPRLGERERHTETRREKAHDETGNEIKKGNNPE